MKRIGPHRRGVTLIELLVVIAVLTIMATVALSTVKGLLRDRKVKQAARVVEQYLETAKIRAITTGRPVAVFMDRLELNADSANGVAFPGNYTCNASGMGEVFPPYTGDIVGATGALYDIKFNLQAGGADLRYGDGFADQVRFAAGDVFSGFGPPPGTVPGPATGQGFVSVGDFIEFEGVNRIFAIEAIHAVSNAAGGVEFAVTFFNPPAPSLYNARMVSNYGGPGGLYYPAYSTLDPVLPLRTATIDITTGENQNALGTDMNTPQANLTLPSPAAGSASNVKFRIFRRPTKSLVGAVTLPRGTCIDLFASGLGLSTSSNDDTTPGTGLPAGAITSSPMTFVPPATRAAVINAGDTLAPSSYNRVGIAFDATGKATQMFADEFLDNGSATPFSGVGQFEIDSKLHLLVGRTDQVTAALSRPTAADKDSVLSNVLDPSNSWVTLNPLTGLISSSPVAAVTDTTVTSWASSADAGKIVSYRSAVAQARALASRGVKDVANN